MGIGSFINSILGKGSGPGQGNEQGQGSLQEKDDPYDKEAINEGELVSFVNKEFERRQRERVPFELQWKLNMAFIEGNQNYEIDQALQDLAEPVEMGWWHQRECFNHIGPIIETRKARLSRMRPVLKTRPGTGDYSDLRASKTGSNLLKFVYDDKQIKGKLADCVAWAEHCGSVFMKNTWNPDAGRTVIKVQEEQAQIGDTGEGLGALDEQLGSVMQGESSLDQAPDQLTGQGAEQAYVHGEMGVVDVEDTREGDIDPIVVPVQEIFPDSPFRQDVQDCRSLIHARAMHVDEIEETWGVRVAPEAVIAMKLSNNLHGLSGSNYGSTTATSKVTSTSLQDHAIVKEYWEMPTKKYPEGRHILCAGGNLIEFNKMPYKVGEDGQYGFPFTKVDVETRPGIFWGRSVVERLIPLQRRYNALRNRKAEYLNRLAIGVVFYQEGSIDPNVVAEEILAPGALIPYKRGFNPPQFAKQDSLPSSFENEMAAILQEFNQISGVSEISRHSADPTLKSGVALQIALEQDDTRLAATVGNIEEFIVRNGKQWLRLYKQFAQSPRILKITGKNNVAEVHDWTAADIQSDDVIVEPYSALAESPAQRRQMVYEFLQAGLFVDPDTGKMSKEMQSKIFEMLEFGNWEYGNDDTEMHQARAERENASMMDGGSAQVADYDDHILHMHCHNRERLTAEFEMIVKHHPQIYQMFDQHIKTHSAMLMQKMMQMQAQMPGPQSPQAGPQAGQAIGAPEQPLNGQAAAAPDPMAAQPGTAI